MAPFQDAMPTAGPMTWKNKHRTGLLIIGGAESRTAFYAPCRCRHQHLSPRHWVYRAPRAFLSESSEAPCVTATLGRGRRPPRVQRSGKQVAVAKGHQTGSSERRTWIGFRPNVMSVPLVTYVDRERKERPGTKDPVSCVERSGIVQLHFGINLSFLLT